MTDFDTQLMPITIPITATDRNQAYHFSELQPTSERVEQIYRNTLAVLVTQRYLQLAGIETDLVASLSWNPLHRSLEDVADLYLPSLEGLLECRSVYQGDRKCRIPQEVWQDRIGYVVVQLDPPYQEGQILGFLDSISVPEVPLSYLRPLDQLINQFLEEPSQPLVQLQQWLKRQFEPDWQPSWHLLQAEPVRSGDHLLRESIERLYRQQSGAIFTPATNSLEALVTLIQTTAEDEVRWQAAELLWKLDPYHPQCPVINVKDLGLYLVGHALALMVGVLLKPDGRFLVLLRIMPLGQQTALPTGLTLVGRDEDHHPFFEVESRPQDHYIQFKFTADAGDRFHIGIALEEMTFTESFMI